MNNIIYSRFVASISDLKKNQMEVANNGFGKAVAILNHNNPAFYCVPADMYERLIDLIEDKELLKLADEAQTQETVKISLNDLQARVHKNPT
ncbi:antitoxin of type II toxin-antitoxin system [Acinetobacter sp. 1294596]|uniref:type II toxin-antitoxin system Phd/YefM family antitoxin n=2 Tax=Acinetobacter TaxID=469 RepID=UPI00044531B8|nr:antitoxin of type II toxin-antitoxin system [Acinetobacter sp. 1294596]